MHEFPLTPLVRRNDASRTAPAGDESVHPPQLRLVQTHLAARSTRSQNSLGFSSEKTFRWKGMTSSLRLVQALLDLRCRLVHTQKNLAPKQNRLPTCIGSRFEFKRLLSKIN